MSDEIVLATDAEVDDWERAIAIARAKRLSVPYPFAPEFIGPGRVGDLVLTKRTAFYDLSPADQAKVPRQPYWRRAERDLIDPRNPRLGHKAGGRLLVTAEIDAMDGESVTITGGRQVTLDVRARRKPVAVGS